MTKIKLKHLTTLNIAHLFHSLSVFWHNPLSHSCVLAQDKKFRRGKNLVLELKKTISTSSLLRNRPQQMIYRQEWRFSTTLLHYTTHVTHETLLCLH